MHMNIPSSSLVPKLAASLVASATLAISAFAFDVINEDFSSGWSGLSASGWTRMAYNTTGAPSLIALDGGTGSAAKFNNVGIAKDFSSTLTLAKDFELTASITASAYQRSVYILVTSAPDAEGKISGYGLVLNTALENNYGGQGCVSIRKLDGVIAADLKANDPLGSNLTTPVASGITLSIGADPTSASQFGSIRLTWNAVDGSLDLYLGGSSVAAASIRDTSFSSFSNIYISGNSAGYFDSLTLTTTASPIPEPGTYALIAGGMLLICALMRQRARRRSA
ncbi:anchor protein [Opitutaceae bacterium TAV5]|nr:anchor protein [Opitutaceae bacterium TAV5]